MAPWQHRRWPIQLTDLLLLLIMLLAGSWLIWRLVSGIYAGYAQSALLFLLLSGIVIGRWGVTWPELGRGALDSRQVFHAILMGVVAVILAIMVAGLMQAGQEQPTQNPQQEALREMSTSSGGIFFTVILVVVVAPFVEELAFRGLLYGWLRQRLDLWQSVIISALVFAVMHDVVMLVPPIAVLGVILALLYERHQSIWPCVIAHAVFNGANMLALYVYVESGASSLS